MIGLGKTDQGSARANNEDSLLVCNESIGALSNLYIVSDGMGGHNAGEIASNKAIEFFVQHIREHIPDQDEQADIPTLMADAVHFANLQVYKISQQDTNLSGMGATFTAASFSHDKLHIAHLGDSRAYLVHQGEIRQVSIDHTYVNDLVRAEIINNEQAKTHHLRNVITRALGSEAFCEVDTYTLDKQDGHKLLLCSDGLTTMLEDDQILEIVSTTPNIEEATTKLVDLANHHGGLDNISVIIVEQEGAQA